MPRLARSPIFPPEAAGSATDDWDKMARKPNYRFERQERERLKAEKKAEKAARKAAGETEPEDQVDAPVESGDEAETETERKE